MAKEDERLLTYYCEKCGKTQRADQFYTSNNLIKYPNNGKLKQCKKCITMHVDNWEPDTYTWILQELDVPYVPKEWNKLLMRYGEDRSKLTGLSILGRYLSVMKLKQYRDFRWKDNDYLQEIENKQIEETMKRQGYSAAQIDEVLKKNTFELPQGHLEEPVYEESATTIDPFPQQTAYQQAIEDELISDLTDDDKRYLCIKWGKTYRADEWVQLEQLYQQMLNSYDIQSAGDLNTLLLACKSSLKANQLLDLGDIEGAQKATKMYDSLMKSGKWTAAQNKTEENEFIDSIGELVTICEQQGFIPRYYVAGPQDHADRVIEDLQKYTNNLINNETGLTSMMENAVKQIQQEEERIKAAAETTAEDEEEKMFNYDDNVMLTDQDFVDFKEFEANLDAENAEILQSLYADVEEDE